MNHQLPPARICSTGRERGERGRRQSNGNYSRGSQAIWADHVFVQKRARRPCRRIRG